MRKRYCDLIAKFRRLPTPLLTLLVLSRFVFGTGLGAVLAAPRKSPWKRVGSGVMAAGVLLALPGAVKVWRQH